MSSVPLKDKIIDLYTNMRELFVSIFILYISGLLLSVSLHFSISFTPEWLSFPFSLLHFQPFLFAAELVDVKIAVEC
jgi:hypothetical protein